MKVKFYAFSLFVLLSVFTTVTWAASEASDAYLTYNKDDGEWFINMPTSGTAMLTITEDQIANGITSFKIYDDGGKNGFYSTDVFATLDIAVPKGYKMELTGRSFTLCFEVYTGCYDKLYVWDGSHELYEGGAKEWYNEVTDKWEFDFIPIDPIYSSANTLTVRFESSSLGGMDEYEGFDGFDLNIRIYDPTVKYDVTFSKSDGKYPNATLQCVPCQAVVGDEVVITANARDGYALKAVKVNGEFEERAVNNQVSLVMPFGGIVVEPVIEPLYSVTVAENPDATIKANLNKTFAGNTVWLEVYPKFGYTLSDLMITDEDETDVDWDFDESGFIYFDMPSQNVVVTPVVSAIETVEGKLQGTDEKYINMPRKDAVAVTIPADVKSFKVYDDGGKDGEYSKSSRGRLLLTAPDGYRMKVTGSVNTGCENPNYADFCSDYVVISDENGNNLYKSGAKKDNDKGYVIYDWADIGTHTSTGNKMTLRFYSDDYQEYAGFEFTVTLEKIPVVNYGAVAIAGNTATIDGNYAGNDEFRITESIEVDEVRLNRTFPVLDGNLYSTLVLPFSISLDKVTGLEALYGFNYMEEGENSLTVHMTLATSIRANTPYFAKMNETSLSFEGPVTIETTFAPFVYKNGWAFVGSYAYKKWAANDPDLLGCNGGCAFGYAAENLGDVKMGQFVKVGAGASIAPMRAYLVKQEVLPKVAQPTFVARSSVSSIEKPLPDYIDIVIDEKDGGTLYVGRFDSRTGEFSKNRYNYTFDIKGRHFGNGNKAKGVYLKK